MVEWWTPESHQMFTKKTECVADFYSGLEMHEFKVGTFIGTFIPAVNTG